MRLALVLKEKFTYTFIHAISKKFHMLLEHILTKASILQCTYTHVLLTLSITKSMFMRHKIMNKKTLVLH
jgi:hypothetical protein